MSILKDTGIMIGSCKNDKTRKEHENEASNLWNKLVSNGSYISTHLVLDKSYDLYREALNCYGTCAYMATAVVCRSTLEAALYKFVTASDLKWRDGENGKEIYTYRYSECATYLSDYNNALSELGKHYPDLFKKVNKDLQKVRERGNFVAHYLSASERKLVRATKSSSSVVELWIDKDGAFSVLEKTGSILMIFAKELEKSCPY